MTIFKKSLQNQKITLKDSLIDADFSNHEKHWNIIAPLSVLFVGVILGMLLLEFLKSCNPEPQSVTATNCLQCHNYTKQLTVYFKKRGSKTPEEMAYAVMQTKSPKLLAAIAVVESNGNYTIRNSGYKKRHHGAFQVNPAIHGNVPTNPIDQAKQAEHILNELTDKHPIQMALSIYGGDSSEIYQQKILSELTKVP